MREYIEERAMESARYIVKNKATVRQAAKVFGISKSTVHKDVTERLEVINPGLAGEIRKVLDVNKAERHLRGGMATREKYSHFAKVIICGGPRGNLTLQVEYEKLKIRHYRV